MQLDAGPTVGHFVVKAAYALLTAGAGALVMYPLRKLGKEWKDLKAELAEAKQELVQQRTNCLSTLQTQGEEQIRLLNKVVDALETLHLGQVEMSGYIRASFNKN